MHMMCVCAKKEKKNRTLETFLQERLNANLIFHSSVAREVENELVHGRRLLLFHCTLLKMTSLKRSPFSIVRAKLTSSRNSLIF